MDRYIDSYFLYTEALAKLRETKEEDLFRPRYFRISDNKISKEDQKKLIEILRKHQKDIYDGDGSLSFLETIDLNFPNKKKFLRLIRELLLKAHQQRKDEEILLLTKLVNFSECAYSSLKTDLDDEEEKDQLCVPFSASESFTFPYYQKTISEPELKLYNNRLYAFSMAKAQAKREEYFPTTRPEVDTSQYNNLSESQIAKMFEKQNFYSAGQENVKALLQSASAEYLQSRGVEPCAVVFEPLALNNKSIQFGEYDPNRGVIIINSNIIDKFQDAKDNDNQAYCYQLLSTVIHESAHRVQFSREQSGSKSYKDMAVSKALLTPQSTLSYSEYLGSVDEVDARNEALAYLKRNAEANNSNSMKGYFNDRKRQEQNNKKADIDPALKQEFGCVYDNQYFSSLSGYMLPNDNADLNSILLAKSSELELQKQRKKY